MTTVGTSDMLPKQPSKEAMRALLAAAVEEAKERNPDSCFLYAPNHIPERKKYKPKEREPDSFQLEIARLKEEQAKAQAAPQEAATLEPDPLADYAAFAASAAQFASKRMGKRQKNG